MAKAATKKAMKASKAKKATKAMKATPDERTEAQTIRRRTIHSGSDREEDEDILTFTQNELATLIAEHLFCGLAGTPDARSWDQCDYEGDLVADRIWCELVRNVRNR